MSENIKEDINLVAALATTTAGFIKNQINGMAVGDGKFVKAGIKSPQEVIKEAHATIVNTNPGVSNRTVTPLDSTPHPPPSSQITLPITSTSRVSDTVPITQTAPQDGGQLLFNFDNSPTAQNIFYKLNNLIERVDRLTERVNTLSNNINNLSENILKKKLDKKEEK